MPILSTLVEHSTKDTTKATYTSSQKQFIQFCESEDLSILPVSETTLLLFIAYLYNKNLKAQSIRVYLAAIHHLHTINGFSFQPYSDSIKAALKGASVLSAPPRRTQPITFDILCQMFEKIELRRDALMMKAVTSMLFFGCLRAGEICIPDYSCFSKKKHVCVKDVVIDEENRLLKLFLKQSKTDRHCNGITIFIGCSGDFVCAFCRFKDYMSSLSVSTKPNSPLFTHHQGVVLTKSYLVNATKLLIGQLGLHSAEFSGHSYRAGSATTAGLEQFSDFEIKLLGRWESSVYHIYLRKPSMVASFAARLANRH